MHEVDPAQVIRGGCPCGWWSKWNCRYIRDRALMCRTPLAERPELPPLSKLSQHPITR